MLLRIQHDTYVAPPHHQVAGMWKTHTQKGPCPPVKIQRAGVSIGIPRLLVEGVNQVRTIRRQPLFVVGPSDSLRDRAPFIQAEQAVAGRYRRWPRCLRLLPWRLPSRWGILASCALLPSGFHL